MHRKLNEINEHKPSHLVCNRDHDVETTFPGKNEGLPEQRNDMDD